MAVVDGQILLLGTVLCSSAEEIMIVRPKVTLDKMEKLPGAEVSRCRFGVDLPLSTSLLA